jgi:hypothetical protein
MLGPVVATSAVSVGFPQFGAVLLLIFGLFLLLAGIFTAYFGSGKSRTIGVVLLVVGIVVGILTAFWYHADYAGAGGLGPLLLEAVLVLVAAIVGALAAVAIFLVAIMKS